MDKVSGIGGFFFRSNNPDRLADRYRDSLGIDLAPQKTGGGPWKQKSGFTVFDPFPADNETIPDGKSWMINFRVDDLWAMIGQLRAAGNEVPDPTEYPYGKFVEFADPKGNGIQLWESVEPNAD